MAAAAPVADAPAKPARKGGGMQMVEVLKTRLQRLEDKVAERKAAVLADADPDDALCSSAVVALQGTDGDAYIPPDRPSIFLPGGGKGGDVDPAKGGASMVVTFRNAPPTDAGKVSAGRGSPIFRRTD